MCHHSNLCSSWPLGDASSRIKYQMAFEGGPRLVQCVAIFFLWLCTTTYAEHIATTQSDQAAADAHPALTVYKGGDHDGLPSLQKDALIHTGSLPASFGIEKRTSAGRTPAESSSQPAALSFNDELRTAEDSMLQGDKVVTMMLDADSTYVWAFNSTEEVSQMPSFTIASGVVFSIRRRSPPSASEIATEFTMVTCINGGDANLRAVSILPRFVVHPGGTFEIGGVAFVDCDGVLVDVGDGGDLSVSECNFSVSNCRVPEPMFNIAGVATFTQSVFTCGTDGSTDHERRIEDEEQLPIMRAVESWLEVPLDALGRRGVDAQDGQIGAALIGARGVALVRVNSCQIEGWALLGADGEADAVVVASSLTVCSGECFRIASDATVSVTNNTRILAVEVADIREAGRLTITESEVASVSMRNSNESDGIQPSCEAFRTLHHARLAIYRSTLSLSGCRGLVSRDSSNVLIVGTLIDAVNTSIVWMLEDSTALDLRVASVIAHSNVNVVGIHRDESKAALFETHMSAPYVLFVSGSAHVAAVRLYVDSWVDPDAVEDDRNVVVLKETASGVFSACRFEGTNLSPQAPLCGRHAIGLRDDATLDIAHSSFVNVPGTLYARERSIARLSAVSISANTVMPTPSGKTDWLQHASVKVCKGGAFLLDDSANLFLGDSVLTALPLVSEGGGVGAFAGASRALITNTTVDVAGGDIGPIDGFDRDTPTVGGGAFSLSGAASVHIAFCRFDNLFTVAFYSTIVKPFLNHSGAILEYLSSGGFAKLCDFSFLNVSDTIISSSRSYNGGLVHADGNSVAVVARVSVGATVAFVDGGVFYVTGEARLIVTDVAIANTFVSLRGGFVYADRWANVVIEGVRLGDMEAYWGALVYLTNSAHSSLSGIVVRSALCKTYQVSGAGNIDDDPRNVRKNALDKATKATFRGCLVFGSSNAYLDLIDVGVADNVTTQFSGAVFGLEGNMTVYTQNMTLASVSAGRSGGVAQLLGTSALNFNGLFVRNASAAINGGIIFATENSTVNAYDVIVEWVFSGQGGGCVRAAGAAHVTLSLWRTEFAATNGPGAVALVSDSSIVFMNVIAVESASAATGALFAVSDFGVAVSMNMTVNSGIGLGNGGCVVVSGSRSATEGSAGVVIMDSAFQSCTSGGSGGLLYTRGNSIILFRRVTVAASRALGGDGGCFAAYDKAILQIENSDFNSTVALNNGGFSSVGGDTSTVMTELRVTSSSCDGHGGVISASVRASLHIILCTFIDAKGKMTGGFISSTDAATIHVLQSSVVRAWSDVGVPGLFVRGKSSVALQSVRLSHLQRPFWPGEGWLSAASGSVFLDDVSCDGCTKDSLLSFDYSLEDSPSLVFENLTDVPSVGTDEERLEMLLSTLRLDRPLRLQFNGIGGVFLGITIDTHLPFALSNVQLDGAILHVRGTGVIDQSIFDGSSLTIGEFGHAVLLHVYVTDTSVIIDGHVQFIATEFHNSRLSISNLGVGHFHRCSFNSLQHTDFDVVPYVTLSRLSFATFVASTIGDRTTRGNGGFARLSGASVLQIKNGNVGYLISTGDGGFISAEIEPSDAMGASLISVADTSFSLLGANGQGGFISLRGSSQATVTNCTFFSVAAGSVGGMAYLAESASLSMMRCTFLRATAFMASGLVGGGFLAVLDSASVDLRSVRVFHASALSSGGFATIASRASDDQLRLPSLTAEDLSIAIVSADQRGGAIECNQCTVSITNGVFGHGYASEAGGFIHISGGGNSLVKFKNCSFDDFSSGVQGGLVSMADKSSVLLEDCHVSNVKSVVYGGAVVMDAGTVVVNNCTFAHTISMSGGGGSFLVRSGELQVSDSVFIDSVATLTGGGFLLLETGGTALLQNVTVDGGRCILAGGGVLRMFGRSSLTAHGLIIRNASAVGCGGALLLDGVADAAFEGLSVNGSTAKFFDGGAICILGKGKVLLSNSDITNSTAGSSGGAISASGNAIAILRGVTVNNAEARDGDGGAVYIAIDALVDISNSTIDGARCSRRGGAIFAASTSSLLTRTLVVRHARAQNGGLLYLADAATATMSNTVGVDLSAADNGGCLYAASGGLELHGGTFIQCRASALPSSYGRGGFLFTDTGVSSLQQLTHLNVIGASSLSAPVVFSSNALAHSQSTGIMFDSLGAISATFEAGNTSFASPVANFSVFMTTSNATVTSFPDHASGAALPEFSIEALDYYGNLAFAPPSRPLAIRLGIVNNANSSTGANSVNSGSSGCNLSGDLRRTFPLSSRVDYAGIRLTATSVPTVCTLGFTPDNFLYDAASPLFQSTVLSVRVSACDVGYERVANASAPGLYYCSLIAVGGNAAASSGGSSSTVVVAVVVPVIVVCAAVCAAAMFAIRRNRKRWNAKQMENFAQHVQTSMPGILSVELPEGSVTLCEQLGEGAFGVVHRAEVLMNGRLRMAAAKSLKSNSGVEQRIEFISEAEIMVSLRHENIVSLVGVVTKTEPMLIVLEFCSYGALHSFLRKTDRGRNVATGSSAGGGRLASKHNAGLNLMFVRLAHDIAQGMAYLASQNIVHKDLAARNVLVAVNAFNELTSKIADFGLSRDVGEKGFYQKKKARAIPVRWTAIESLLHSTYDEKSDVWSFGVVLWEIWSFAAVPYPGVSNTEVLSFIRTEGRRLSCPDGCPRQVYKTMFSCWAHNPAERPSFTQLVTVLSDTDSLLHTKDVDVKGINSGSAMTTMTSSHEGTSSPSGRAVTKSTDAGVVMSAGARSTARRSASVAYLDVGDDVCVGASGREGTGANVAEDGKSRPLSVSNPYKFADDLCEAPAATNSYDNPGQRTVGANLSGLGAEKEELSISPPRSTARLSRLTEVESPPACPSDAKDTTYLQLMPMHSRNEENKGQPAWVHPHFNEDESTA